MSKLVKVAAVQLNPVLMNTVQNMASVQEAVLEAAEKQADLIVFPECCLSGYIFNSREEALPYAELIPGTNTEIIISLCQKLKIYLVIGLLEKDNDKLFNTALLIGPGGIIGKYRKNHLPFLGVDRFVDSGNKRFEVYGTPIGNIGMFICYDILFPETARIMMLMGADILVLPTNFPTGRGEKVVNYIVTARAMENRVHLVAVDRVGTERGASFAGLSTIVDASGAILNTASSDKEEIIYAEIDLDMARQKHVTVVPGEYEVDYIHDRRPELYECITQPVNEESY